MTAILYMALLGFLAGCISGFWTRIIEWSMIFDFVGEWLNEKNRQYIAMTGRGYPAPISKFLRCVFCLTPWLCFLFDLWYIISYAPHFFPALIGVFASLGAGNMIAEIIYALRNGE
jgi:hypothetical protein